MTLRAAEKRQAHRTLHRMGSLLAMVGSDFNSNQEDAREDESEGMLALYSDLTAMTAYFFLEIVERVSREGIPVYNLGKWADAYTDNHGQEWDEAKRRRFDYLMAEYKRMLDEQGGDIPEGPFKDDFKKGRYFIQFERPEDDEDDE